MKIVWRNNNSVREQKETQILLLSIMLLKKTWYERRRFGWMDGCDTSEIFYRLKENYSELNNNDKIAKTKENSKKKKKHSHKALVQVKLASVSVFGMVGFDFI